MNTTVRIEVVNKAINTFEGKSKATGNPFKIHRQEAYLHNGHHYPDRFDLTLNGDGPLGPVAYEPGFYTIDPSSVVVNREYGNLELDRYNLKLVPITDAASKPRAA
ncbi:single-stranded DNA-binding protein [Xanthomonas euvesicatoria]|uniref:single-stranded DNA-binding protein n=1 Tax=Xanthomonas euvesicatoria TaxID=456327 RepID=UPI00062D3B7E|nr:single-stranded DNA-binding protein [Xanthomonas euvesicatoria]APO90440.1 helix-destabilizing protein [Xanthomonas euvesicatoria]KLB35675.1 helix-destabilizing protein [Xanthomonas euvesicatoria]MCC8584038.1 G5P family DNA-binding protein [Xanthomonas euvesicatoria pv. euvesicatoria]MCC8593921.1 G5P family DNA-binding protein [Xanthomonas euvesicatoria pv. euvesicatoria]